MTKALAKLTDIFPEPKSSFIQIKKLNVTHEIDPETIIEPNLFKIAQEIISSVNAVSSRSHSAVRYIIEHKTPKNIALDSLHAAGIEKSFASKIFRIAGDPKISKEFLKESISFNKAYAETCFSSATKALGATYNERKESSLQPLVQSVRSCKLNSIRDSFTEKDLWDGLRDIVGRLLENYRTPRKSILTAVEDKIKFVTKKKK